MIGLFTKNTAHDKFLSGEEIGIEAEYTLACSRLRDGGGKSFSNKKCKKCAGAGERQGATAPTATAPFPKTCASYFRFIRFNTFPLYYLRAWHRLSILLSSGHQRTLFNRRASRWGRESKERNRSRV